MRQTPHGEPLTPPSVRVSYSAVHQVSVHSLFTPKAPLSLFKTRLASASWRIGPPCYIRDNLMFSPSLVLWVLRLSVTARFTSYYDLCWPLAFANTWTARSPPVRAFSVVHVIIIYFGIHDLATARYIQCLRYLLWVTLQRCACLSSTHSLIYRLLISVFML